MTVPKATAGDTERFDQQHNPAGDRTQTVPPFGAAGQPMPSGNDFAALKARIKRQGLLDKQYRYYAFVMLRTMGMLAFGIVCLTVVDQLWLQLLDAALLAFVGTQIAFIAHDA